MMHEVEWRAGGFCRGKDGSDKEARAREIEREREREDQRRKRILPVVRSFQKLRLLHPPPPPPPPPLPRISLSFPPLHHRLHLFFPCLTGALHLNAPPASLISGKVFVFPTELPPRICGSKPFLARKTFVTFTSVQQ